MLGRCNWRLSGGVIGRPETLSGIRGTSNASPFPVQWTGRTSRFCGTRRPSDREYRKGRLPEHAPLNLFHSFSALGGASTLVILMGIERLAEIVQQLLDGGIDPATPVAIIEQGTQPGQRTFTTTIANASADCAGARPPAVIVVGAVVSLREEMQWFEKMDRLQPTN